MSNLEMERMARIIENQRITQESNETIAINKLLNNTVEDRFKEFGQCMKCGKQKTHDNYPMCPKCYKTIDNSIQKENNDFIQGKYFAGMNQVDPDKVIILNKGKH